MIKVCVKNALNGISDVVDNYLFQSTAIFNSKFDIPGKIMHPLAYRFIISG
jgi:hypothetical protein